MMKLATLIEALPDASLTGNPGQDVAGLYYDSRKVEADGAFFALRGATVDGHDYIDAALARGARTIFLERLRELPPGISAVRVGNARRAMALAAERFYGAPTADIPVVGVTGTNGKTTITYLIESMLQAAGRRPAVLGTINYRCGEQQLPSLHTTPESVDLAKTLARFREAAADALVMEVSSHALDQYRVDGVRFDVGIFTNLTPEHLDYHGTMDAYFASKSRFFSELLDGGKGGVVNLDDPYGQQLAARFPAVLTCGRHSQAAVRPLAVRLSLGGIEATLATPIGELKVHSRLVGEFNLQNLLCAVAGGIALGLPAHAILGGLSAAPSVPGRLERIENRCGALVLVDYAHTGDALEKVLETLNGLGPARIVTVFGCGGDRDPRKRPVMGEVAARLSDLAIITSDNPRTEDPLAIIAAVRAGALRVHPREWTPEEARTLPGRGFVTIPDRAAAIAYAVDLIGERDLLLVAGKGHEDYQILGTRRIHFDDREQLRDALMRKEGGAA
ncbi:MAG: UDP-N-acetylmuramoyl-L-alanyl-D-glutamate--2,6-diaminopimelate ligase [Trichloromonas sp.]|nr:UDP-N-acetylmuramoyl-L-alanyl-D-glutamate--2,6-diaminopimelate ligase [Trichloromonas sp.]